jgi:hypothetical protein
MKKINPDKVPITGEIIGQRIDGAPRASISLRSTSIATCD